MGMNMGRFLSIATLFTICLLCNGNLSAPCKQNERQALLMFKHDLPSNPFSSTWVGEGDCCNWTGVVCDNLTGHVLELHLASWKLEFKFKGKLNPSLLNLTHLSHLDLSNNDFEGLQIPSFLGSLTSLRYLNLSSCWVEGIIPHQLGNLSSLRVLDMRDNYNLQIENLHWISGLSLLQHLDMSYANLSKASDWYTLPSLIEYLDMSICGLYHIPGGIVNMTSLKVLNLEGNSISSTIPKWLYNLSHLQSLLLSVNHFHGEISPSLGNLTSIANLYLSDNQLEGKIPNSLGSLCKLTNLDLSENNLNGSASEIFESFSRCSSGQIESVDLSSNNLSGHLTDKLEIFENLRFLDLSSNSISGPLPLSFGNLSCLEEFSISYNKLTGVVSQLHFTNLTRLMEFDAYENSLTLKTTPHWIPPFQLVVLTLTSFHLEPSELPMWLQTQTHLWLLHISNTGISGTIPSWFWNFSSQLSFVDLSQNNLYGEVPNILVPSYASIFLGSNQFNGSLPLVSSTVVTLDLSNSSFSGTLFHFFCNNNSEPKVLSILHLEHNLLSGKIPDCFRNWKYLLILNLESNNLIGNIPRSLGYLLDLEGLHLRNSNLSGELTPDLQNCTGLTILDLGHNKFLGRIPIWIGTSLSNLMVLSLGSNKLHGHIPDKLCSLANLHILDLAHNNLSGRIPRCLYNFTAMAIFSDAAHVSLPLRFSGYFDTEDATENAIVVTKGREVKYGSLLQFPTSLDLSGNIISGEIPQELTSLIYLQSMNLSNNLLTGRIPSKIGNMRWLESLDLSMNQLFGNIAPSMSNLTFLSALNLSYNNLTGEIPKSTQLQSFDQSSFIGNKLCGPPLEVNCSTKNGAQTQLVAGEKHGGCDLLEDGWFYVSLGLGFLLGFWSVLGSLLLNLPWSIVFNRFQNRIVKKLYGLIVEHF